MFENLNKSYVDAKKKTAGFLKAREQREVEKSVRVPPGQRVVQMMVAMPPVVSVYPHIDKAKWKLKAFGEVGSEVSWGWGEFNRLPKKDYVVDFHCVTSWTKLDQHFTGIPFAEIVKLVRPLPSVRHVIFWCAEGYTTNVIYQELLDNVAFIAVKMDSHDIEDKYGGLARVVIPHLYGWKSAKHVTGIRFQSNDEPGFWETRGYNNHADPWKEERYSD